MSLSFLLQHMETMYKGKDEKKITCSLSLILINVNNVIEICKDVHIDSRIWPIRSCKVVMLSTLFPA